MSDLIFDIGLHRGDDSAYYLCLGYRVVGVEANPLLAIHCMQRFANEIQQGRMLVVNAGVLKEPGTCSFYRSLLDDGWSSFVLDRVKKKGEWEKIDIPCISTLDLIADHGKPFFMKVDIEGADFQALCSITPSTAPAYISLELNCHEPIIERLIELGYSAFKFVDGETYWPTPPIFNHELGWRLLRKAGRLAPFIRAGISRLPQRIRAKSEWNPPGKYSPDCYPFTACNSGPFGEQAAGSWITPVAAVRWFEVLKANYRRAGSEDSMWWDVHARHCSVVRRNSSFDL